MFKPLYVKQYIDWGSYEDWQRFYRDYFVFFVELNGIVTFAELESNSSPKHLGKPLLNNIEKINQWVSSGTRQVILTTSFPETRRAEIEKYLDKYGVQYHQLIFGLNLGKKVLVDKVSVHKGIIGCDHVNVPINSESLAEIIL